MSDTILVVDDDTAIRELLAAVLEEEGYDVLQAADGVDALRCVERELPSLILLDVMMPRLDGYDFVRELERRGLRSDVSIVALSAAAHIRGRYKRLGADGFLGKPFELERLLAEVKRVLAY